MHASRAPRILFCTDTYPPQVNGVSVVTALSVVGLAQRGWECAVIAPRYPVAVRDAFGSHDASRAVTEGASLPSMPLPFYPDLRLAVPDARAVAACVDRFQPDLVHCETEFVIGFLGQRAAVLRGLPVTSSYHTDFARYADAYGLSWLRPRVSDWIARFHRRSTFTVTPSEPARQDLIAMGVPQALVWGRGVDVDTFHPGHRSEALRAAYGRRDAFIFLHVGRLAAEKGTDRIVRAYELVRQQLPEGAVHLVIAGAGPCERDLRAISTTGITYLGNLDRKTVLPRLYASADAFVFASLTETLGLVVLEAMSSGLPVIAAPAGGVADHLCHEVNGLAYPPADVDQMAKAMIRLALDRRQANRLGLGARRTAERLSWEAELDRLDTICREASCATPREQFEAAPAAAS